LGHRCPFLYCLLGKDQRGAREPSKIPAQSELLSGGGGRREYSNNLEEAKREKRRSLRLGLKAFFHAILSYF